MKPESARITRLHSWKEISALLGCDIRTCLRYEKEYGLPVYRVGGMRKGSVFAYREELEQWMAGFAVRRREAKTARAQSRAGSLFRVVAAAAGVATVALLLLLFKGVRMPEKIEVRGNALTALDRNGQPLWSRVFDRPLHPVYSRWFEKWGGGGILFCCAAEDNDGLWSELLCLTRRGRTLWSYRPGRVVRTPAATYDDRYLVRQAQEVKFEEGGGQPAFLVCSSHAPWYIYEVAVLDSSGSPRGRYWNAGHVSDGCLRVLDLDGDGRSEILCAGQNNDYNRACLFVLDPEEVRGRSPQEGASARRFLGIEAGAEKAYLLFPRSVVAEQYELRNFISNILIKQDEREIELLVVERAQPEASLLLRYTFDFNLNLKRIEPEDELLTEIKRLRFQGKITPEEERNLFAPGEGLLYWDGSSWRVEPLPTVSR
ncbi:MAG: hypothetical protein FJY83_00400 [Candidatus Aminicenantes bacterium]|nr:hypothetical protein [Candidatus Aminicenantes bacterium]